MARIRSIHPGFFTDEAIVSLSPQAQIFFVGLWTQCDDQGVFEWKPVTLKMRLLPATNADVPALLTELQAADVIRKAEVGASQLGFVRNFRKFQRPKKPNSLYPFPAEFRPYVGLSGKKEEPPSEQEASSSPPVPHQGGTGSEISPQREEGEEEEGGIGEKDDGEESLSHVAVPEADEPSVASAQASEEPNGFPQIPEFLRRKGTGVAGPIAPDWQPSQSARDQLAEARPDLTEKIITRRMHEFRSWCAANAVTTHNPDASWFSFMVKTNVQSRQAHSRSADSGAPSVSDGISAAFARRSVPV